MGRRMFKGKDLLLAKFAYRKSIKYGRILERPCICRPANPKATAICPVHVIWHIIRERADAGELLFRGWNSASFYRHLRKMMVDLGYSDGVKFSPEAFRRGDSEEIKNSGSTFATILTSETWNGAGYNASLDLQKDEDVNITALLLENGDSDTSEGYNCQNATD